MRCQADVAEWQSHQRPRRQPSLRDEDRHPTGRQSRAAVVCTPFVCYSAAPRYCAPASVPVRYVVKMSSSCSVRPHNVRVNSQFEFHRHSCVYEQCRRAREVCIRSVPRYPHSLPSPVRNPGKRPPASGLHGWVRPLCTFRLMLTPPSRSSPRWRWHALSEALEETSCRGWHLRDSKPQAAARLSCRGGRTVSYRVR